MGIAEQKLGFTSTTTHRKFHKGIDKWPISATLYFLTWFWLDQKVQKKKMTEVFLKTRGGAKKARRSDARYNFICFTAYRKIGIEFINFLKWIEAFKKVFWLDRF